MTNLVRLEPFRELMSLRETMDRLFEESVVRPRAGWLAPIEAATLAVRSTISAVSDAMAPSLAR